MSEPPRTVEILVSPEGRVKLTTHGFLGSSCKRVTRFLKAALGKVLSEKKTPEYYQTLRAEPLPPLTSRPEN